MTHDDLFICANPGRTGYHDERHICESRDDHTRPMLDANNERCYPFTILTYRCIGCGSALTNQTRAADGTGKWARYIIEEEPW